MAKEILAVPEESLGDVILILRTGIETLSKSRMIQDCVQPETVKALLTWCKEEEEYLRRSR